MDYFKPKTISEALSLKSEKSMFIAGGTDLGVHLFDFLVEPESLIDLTGIEELSGISFSEEEIIIGACTGIDEIAGNIKLPYCLSAGASSIGSPQIRNMATVGGNICNASPCGDTLTPLIVLDSVFIVTDADTVKTVKPSDFFLGPKKTILKESELLKEIRIPISKPGSISDFKMIGKRKGQAISQVNTALRLELEEGIIKGIRIAAGSVAPVPIRLVKTEKSVIGMKLSKDVGNILKKSAREEIIPISDVRATDSYRRSLVGTMLSDMLNEILKPEVV